MQAGSYGSVERCFCEWSTSRPLRLQRLASSDLSTRRSSFGVCQKGPKLYPVLLQALAEEMDVQNERLGWLNKHAPQILSSPGVSPASREQHVGKLRAINLSWSKVDMGISPLPLRSSLRPTSSRRSPLAPSAGHPRLAGQSRGGGGQPAEPRPVQGQIEPTHRLGGHHAPDHRDQGPEPEPGAGNRPADAPCCQRSCPAFREFANPARTSARESRSSILPAFCPECFQSVLKSASSPTHLQPISFLLVWTKPGGCLVQVLE